MELRRTITGIVNFYVDGFRHMTWGRTLWIVILVKLVIIFVLLRIFFFLIILPLTAERCEKAILCESRC